MARALATALLSCAAFALPACTGDDDSPKSSQDASMESGTEAGAETGADALEAGLEAADAPGPDTAFDVVESGSDSETDVWEAAFDSELEAADSAFETDTGEAFIQLKILHTSDEHGSLEPSDTGTVIVGGAANVMGWWKQREGYDPASDLALTGGDSLVDQPMSSLFLGQSMIEVLNSMGYSGSAMGNHELGYGQTVFASRAAEATWPFLAANMRRTATGQQYPGTEPYRILTRKGLKIGVIGVANSRTAGMPPGFFEGVTYDAPLSTLDAVVPKVRAEGADLVIALTHESFSNAVSLASGLTAKPDVIFSGHDHLADHQVVSGIPVVGSKRSFEGYSVVRLTWDNNASSVTSADVEYVSVQHDKAAPAPFQTDSSVQAVVDKWRAQVDAQLGMQIGASVTGVKAGTWAMANWITDAILSTYPAADVVIQNGGGAVQGIAAGPFTAESIWKMLPYEQHLVELQLTGAQLVQVLATDSTSQPFAGCFPLVAGVTFTGSGSNIAVKTKAGTPIEHAATYRVIVNDFIYYGGLPCAPLKGLDPTPVDLGVNPREAVVNWTKAVLSSASDPIEAHIDPAPRNQ